jgi:hypothetical protein
MIAAGRPDAIILFGSEAHQTSRDDSDFDFLIIDRHAPSRHPRSMPYQLALRPCPVETDILVRTPEEIQQTAIPSFRTSSNKAGGFGTTDALNPV